MTVACTRTDLENDSHGYPANPAASFCIRFRSRDKGGGRGHVLRWSRPLVSHEGNTAEHVLRNMRCTGDTLKRPIPEEITVIISTIRVW